MTIRRMECCVCGADAGRWTQHWNRDTGYGVCVKCIKWLRARNTSETEIADLYGKEGVNWGAQVIWNETTEDHYDEMLGCVPPVYMSGNGFLVGEAYDIRECSVTHKDAYTYRAFIRDGESYFKASEPLTIAEFKASRGVR